MGTFKIGDRVQLGILRAGRVYTVAALEGDHARLVECTGLFRASDLHHVEPKPPTATSEIPESQSYEAIGAGIGKLVEKKQRAYGDSFGKCGDVMRILYPDGIPPEKFDDALTIVRVIDKLFRIATDRDALGENPWKDIAGYALLATKRAKPCDS